MKKTSVYIETFGCQMNVADTERAASKLRASGCELTLTADTADVVLFNTCSVRARAEQKVFNRIGELRKQRPTYEPVIGILGCVAQLEGTRIFKQAPMVQLVVGTRAIDRLPALIERVRNGERQVLDIGERTTEGAWKTAITTAHTERHSPYVAFVPIVEGCNKFCSYCIVPYSRGREQSRTAREVIQEINQLRQQGFQEVHLIGQNVNSYRPRTEDGLEKTVGSTPFARLLRAVAIETLMPRIKFTTSFPRDFHRDIVQAMDEHPNLCNWVHLPVQAGSDRVLRAMRRGYGAADYLARVEAIRCSQRRIALTSDVIVGFPGESAEDFAQTQRLVEQCKFDGLYIYKYSARRDTPAAALLDDVPEQEKTRRFLALEELQKKLQHEVYTEYVGRTLSILVEGESAKSPSDMTGHSTCHKVVNFRGDAALMGRIATVQVTTTKANSLYGKLRSVSQ